MDSGLVKEINSFVREEIGKSTDVEGEIRIARLPQDQLILVNACYAGKKGCNTQVVPVFDAEHFTKESRYDLIIKYNKELMD